MSTDQEQVRRDWRMPDEWWARLQRLLPPRKLHPLGCHRPRVDARQAKEAMFFVRRTGCQVERAEGNWPLVSRAAHRRCHEWTAAGASGCVLLVLPNTRL